MAMASRSICARFCLAAARPAASSCLRLPPTNSLRFARNAFKRSITSSSPAFHSKASHGACAKATLERMSEPTTIGRRESMESSNLWKIKMLYDGECPLCMREVNMLQERNKLYGTIKFIDISSDDYSPEENAGLDYMTVMGRIHAILHDGTVLTDIVAFRRLYEEVGLGWVYAITKYEPIATIGNTIYAVWARYRLQITGRPPLAQILEEREERKICRILPDKRYEVTNIPSAAWIYKVSFCNNHGHPFTNIASNHMGR